jgi:uncharacterized Ntn-hydrolase superfamily protein
LLSPQEHFFSLARYNRRRGVPAMMPFHRYRSLPCKLALPLLAALSAANSANATYSIAACDAKTRACGVAVQTNNLAVGASVPFAKAGVGAGASQFETNPHYGPRALELLAQGKSPEQVLRILLQEDDNFEGQGPEARQVGIVSFDGRAFVHSGEEVMEATWAGSRIGPGYTIQGNGLAGPEVLAAMESAFLKSQGSLGERLMRALVAGEAAGGQKTGKESAALLVRTEDGWPIDIDLRVDHSANPVADLQALFNMQSARQQMGHARRAAQQGHNEDAKAAMIQAVAQASEWSRIWLQGARVAYQLGEDALAVQYLSDAFSQNSAWIAEELRHGRYPALGGNPVFHRWISQVQQEHLVEESRALAGCDVSSVEERVQTAAMLLEAGKPKEAISVLSACPEKLLEDGDAQALFAEAYANNNDRKKALAFCLAALKFKPTDPRLLALRMSLEQRQ